MSKRFARVDQLLVSLGYGTRREVQRLIKEMYVTRTDGVAVKEDDRIDPALIRMAGEPLDHPEGILIALHKPLGYVCSHNEEEGRLIYELVPEQWLKRDPKLVTVGRLDKETSGLILLTDQSELVHQWTSPKKHVKKIYEVTLRDPLPLQAVEIFAAGTLMLKGESKPCLPATLVILDEFRVHLTLSEGKYHQVRRMFAACGNHVERLHRLRFGELSLEGIKEGEYRFIKVSEVGP